MLKEPSSAGVARIATRLRPAAQKSRTYNRNASATKKEARMKTPPTSASPSDTVLMTDSLAVHSLT